MKWGSSWPPTLTLLSHEMVTGSGIKMPKNNEDFKDDYAFIYYYFYIII